MLLVIAKQKYIIKRPKAEQNQAESTQVSPNTSKLAVADRGADRTQPKGTNEPDSTTPKQSEKNAEKRRKQNRTQKVFL